MANNSGNGLGYFAEDDYIYYPGDKVIGRYGPISGTATFNDDFLGSQGGVPTNTASIDLESGSSMYAYSADTASLSITGNISLEAWVKPESLPASGSSMTLISKWDSSGTLRSYKMDIAGVSGYFGDGGDGALTISADTTEAPIDSGCTATSGTPTISATNASFAADQQILVYQTRGSGAGTWERHKILSYTAGTITTVSNLVASYVSGAQIRVLPEYTNVTIDSGITYTTKAWDGTVGGVLAFLANGTVTVTGTITASGKGYRGGAGVSSTVAANQGEGTAGAGTGSQSANGNGGGGGGISTVSTSGPGGAGGANGAAAGNNGAAMGGAAVGSTDLTTACYGGGGGSGLFSLSGTSGAGGNGGGLIFISAATVTITGAITNSGSTGSNGTGDAAGGSGGAGGSTLLKAQVATLGSGLVTASAGTGGSGSGAGGPGVDGTVGRIHLDYYTSYTGTTSPTLDVTQDNNLVTNTTYQLRLAVSSTGLNSETLTKEISSLQTALWQHLAVTWTASTSVATFYFNGVSLGTTTGTLTAIHNNASEFFIATNKNDAGSAANFYDGLMDDARVWNTVRTANEISVNMSDHVLTTAAGLQAYYKLESGVTDSTANANNLTASGSPTYSTDVPFSGATTRLDIDQSATTTGNSYTVPTAISETATNRKTFTPAKDPQKSIAVLVAVIGTGDWTLTVHDTLNNSIASATITNANMGTGYQEFTFTTPWRPIINTDYHLHLTSTVGDGTVTCTTASDLTTVSYRTYYQFLVTDTEWHFAAPMLNFMVFGNERYLAKYEATLYYPNHITFPAGWRARCYGYWREYLAIGMQKGSAFDENDQGRIYFWDGIAPTFNFFIDVPEGTINAMKGSKGKLNIIAGYQGDLMIYQGGDAAEKIKRIPKITDSTTIEIYPAAMDMWKSLLRIGVAGGGTSTVIQKGVYTWGSLNTRYAESLSYDYPMSTGTLTGTTTKVGMVTVVNKKMLISLQDNISYGVDYVDSANDPYATGTLELKVDDEQAYWHDKAADTAITHFDELNSGETVRIKYKLDEDSSFTTKATSTVDDTSVKIPINGKRYKQYQLAVDLETTTTTSPKVHAVAIKRDFLQTEEKMDGRQT